jgi:hypothetical protein
MFHYVRDSPVCARQCAMRWHGLTGGIAQNLLHEYASDAHVPGGYLSD